MYFSFQSLLLIFAFRRIGFRFAFRTALVVISVVIIVSVLPNYQFASPEPHNERILLVIFGGILAGIAKAVAFRNGSSTGDEDIPLNWKYSQIIR
jgi:uncharacterized membrane-anchored protein YitT (DUF2179 family)